MKPDNDEKYESLFKNDGKQQLMDEVAVIIPARYGSTRFPGKPLTPVGGRPLILHVLDRAREISSAAKILVATDDQRIADVVRKEGGEVAMTPSELASGSDRVGWVARNLHAKIIVNLQGDEPLIDTRGIRKAMEYLEQNASVNVSTLGYPLDDEAKWKNPNVVKVLTNLDNKALYFSRSPVPNFRESRFHKMPGLFQHLGVYVYRREFLLNFLELEPAPFETAEKLEQLRILHYGYHIQVIQANFPSAGIDSPEDVEKVEQLLKEKVNFE
ncbi:MAG: 3-deoxy-manno-octulosonate cytidylyltransferase [Calditrichia bacterium]